MFQLFEPRFDALVAIVTALDHSRPLVRFLSDSAAAAPATLKPFALTEAGNHSIAVAIPLHAAAVPSPVFDSYEIQN